MSEPTEPMPDRLAWLLERFALRASVFQAGPLAQKASFEPRSGIGYVHLLQRGVVEVQDRGEPLQRVAAPAVFMYLNPTHTQVRPQGADTLIVCATFEFGLSAGNPLQAALPKMHCLTLAQAPALTGVMRQVEFEAVEHHCGQRAILDRLCEVSVVLVLRELMDQQRLNVGLLAGLADAKLCKALTAMHAQPQREWKLGDMASCAGMSRARFAVRFRQVMGLTPGAYLAEWRIGVAQALLLEGETLSVIADAVGYGSASALSRAFQQRRRCSPGDWLKRQRSAQ